jgi:hypothetical protein
VAGVLGLAWFFPPHLFAQQFSDSLGHIGRNNYRGDPSFTTGVRVQRVFNLGERVKAEASGEVFNLLNRHKANGIDTARGTPDFLGSIPQKFGDGVGSPANPTLGTPNFVAPARQIQRAMRLNF